MPKAIDFGPINGHLIGFAMKEAMYRAMEKIRATVRLQDNEKRK